METRSGEGMRRISWLVAGGLAGLGAARLAGADRWRLLETPAAPLMSFTPHVAAASLLGSVLLPRRGPAEVAALTGAALAATVLPRALRQPQPRAGGPVLRVVTVNMLAGQAAEEPVVDLVRRTDTDVLFVQELTETAMTRFKQAGLTDMLPHDAADPRPEGGRGSGIYARFPLTGGLTLRQTYAAQPTARMRFPDGGQVDLVCAHPHPPNPPLSRVKIVRWREELAVLPPAAVPDLEPPRVLAGDFNASLDHVAFRRLLRLGHADAASQAGRGLAPTWSPWGSPALVTLDHVLVDPRCEVREFSVHPLPGSDHRAVYAEFRLPG
jgi:endonuclease/exonuclease/phosphatase (EEP) superfamily protein YafD